MPQYLSGEAQSLLRCLFKRNPSNRLGSGPLKGHEIKSHEFFASLDFEKLLRKEIKPPYIPAPISDSQTHFHFQDKEKQTNTTTVTHNTKATSSGVSSATSSEHVKAADREMHTDSPGVPASASAYELFRGFSFVAPMLLDEDICSMRKTPGIAKTSGAAAVNNNLTIHNNNHSFSEPAVSSTTMNPKSKTSNLISKCKGRTLSEYEFLEVIGSGSFSVCKRCVHTTTGKEYAVKVSVLFHLMYLYKGGVIRHEVID
jgi:p90 ribosomal S6 kinase